MAAPAARTGQSNSLGVPLVVAVVIVMTAIVVQCPVHYPKIEDHLPGTPADQRTSRAVASVSMRNAEVLYGTARLTEHNPCSWFRPLLAEVVV